MTGSGASTFSMGLIGFIRLVRFCARFFVRGRASSAIGLALAASACTGATDSGLFGSNGGVNDVSAIDAGHTVHDASSSPGDHDAHVDPLPSGDGAPPPQEDAAPIDASLPDVAPPADAPGIRCGNAICDPTSDVCCRIPGGASDVFACVPEVGCTAINGALTIPCDDAVDCAASGPTNGTPGANDDVCCVTLNAQSGQAEAIACAPAQSCTSTLQTNMCDTNAPDACPNGGTCKISQTTIPGYDICF